MCERGNVIARERERESHLSIGPKVTKSEPLIFQAKYYLSRRYMDPSGCPVPIRALRESPPCATTNARLRIHVPARTNLGGMRSPKVVSTWVVVKMMVPFWVP